MAATNAISDLEVLIIGAGSVGLLIAQNLKKLGIKTTVYERENYLNQRTRDWNFGIFWAQGPLAECLSPSMNEKLLNALVDPNDARKHDNTLPIFNAETGDLMVRQPTPGVLRLRRSEMRKVAAEGIDIQYDKRLQTVQVKDADSRRVTAVFEDGTEATGDLLIGADGANSRVRSFLLGSRGALQELPLVGCSTCGPLSDTVSRDLFDAHKTHCVSYHPKGLVAYISLHALNDVHRPETWQWQLILTWRYPPGKALSVIEARKLWDTWSSQLAEPIRTAFLAAPEKAQLYCERISQWPTIAWDNLGGRVTLAGDAAHPMTFHRGQGLNNAVSDAAYLGRALNEHRHGSKPLAEAISEYEREVVERGYNAVISSGQNSMMITDWSQLMESPMMRFGLSPDKKA